MRYRSVKKAKFIKRPNRFLAHVYIDGTEEVVHVKNTGRCKEILQEGITVILEESQNTERKTRFSLVAGYKDDILINIDSQVPNTVVYEAIKGGRLKEFPAVTRLDREKTYGKSRFDLYFESTGKKGFIEVKGVTLEREGAALFPDAPTERGSKHVYEMIKAVEEGYEGYIFFLIQMKGVKLFKPNELMDPEFAQALRQAANKGVKVIAYDSQVQEDGITIGEEVQVFL